MAENAKRPRRLASYVEVGGNWYGPEDDVPDDVAAKIGNPKAWAADDGADEDSEGPPKEVGTRSGHRLAAFVEVGGRSYGPDDYVPDDVAAKIRNPKAWQGGKAPDLAAAGSRATAGEGGATGGGDAGSAAGGPPPPAANDPSANEGAGEADGDRSAAGDSTGPAIRRPAAKKAPGRAAN